MRPVNLIPSDDRRSGKTPVGSGPAAYMLVGALVLGLAAMVMLVLTNNKISDHKAEVADLKQQEVAVQARATELAAFTNFSSLEQSRRVTVKNLADSRFDWERVLRELSRTIPADVWLTDLNGAASSSSAAGATDTASAAGTSSIAGPSLTIQGCASGHDSVAGFLSSLRDIDGVTRVGLTSSERASGQSGGGGGGTSGDSAGGGGGSTDCRTRDFIAKFEVVVAFDNAPVPSTAATATAPATPATTAPPATTDATATPASDTGQ